MRTGADNPGTQLSLSRRTFDGQERTGADRCGQPWFPGVSLSWRTFGGQVRTGVDNPGS